MGSLGSKPSRASPQCDTNFGCACPKVWRSGRRGPRSTDPSRTCPCSPPQWALAGLCLGSLLTLLARLVCCKALAPCPTSPATSSDVPQRRQVLPWTETLQTTSLPPLPCCSREASLRFEKEESTVWLILTWAPTWNAGMPGSKRVAVGLGLPKGSWQPSSTLSFGVASPEGQGQVGGAVERMVYPYISLLCPRPFLLETLWVLPWREMRAINNLALAL